MNSDHPDNSARGTPPPDPVSADEARVLAVLLGEASPFETEAAAELLSRRPDLRAYRDRTAALLGLLPDAAKPEPVVGNPVLRLDESRRATLLEKLREPGAGASVSGGTIQFSSAGVAGRGRLIGFFRTALVGSRRYAALLAVLLLVAAGLSLTVSQGVRGSRRADAEPAQVYSDSFATAAGGASEKSVAPAKPLDEPDMKWANPVPFDRDSGNASAPAGDIADRVSPARDLLQYAKPGEVAFTADAAAGASAPAPALGDLPAVGKLFRSDGKTDAAVGSELARVGSPSPAAAVPQSRAARSDGDAETNPAPASATAISSAGLAKTKAQPGKLESAAGAKDASGLDDDAPLPGAKKPATPPVLRAETPAAANAFSTFSLNVSDVSFRLAGEAVRRGAYPDSGGIRTEEFVNAQVYRDPMPRAGEAVALRQEQARHPFAHNRTLLRLSLKTAAEGRDAASPLNLVLLLDNSGSMERADRRETVAAAGAVLADNLRAGDKVSVIGFARDTRLLIDRMDGADTRPLRELAKNGVPAEGGTNLENALDAAYAQLARQTPAGGSGRVLLLTDGAANLGDADPARLAAIVETNRRQGRALDAFGIGFDGYNDTLLETLSRKGDGRYAYLNDAGEVRAELGQKLAGALRPFASDVKVQVEFNPARVNAWRLLGYDNHRLRKEDFRNNKVDAAELAAAESGTALYALELKPDGAGDIGVVRVRYRVPGTQDYKEREWPVVNTATPAFADAPEGIRLSGCAAFVAEALAGNPDAAGIDRAELRKELARLAAGRPDDPRLATLRLLAEKLAP